MDSGSRKISFIPRLKRYRSLDELYRIRPWKDPWRFFKALFNEAQKSEPEANAACLCTTGPNGRMILVKNITDNFIFFTSEISKKSQEIKQDNRVCLVFYWPTLDTQVRVYGTAYKIDRKVALDYFHSRPITSQISSAISMQSKVLGSWKEFANLFKRLVSEGCTPKCPRYWTGYKIKVKKFEFWFGSADRLHRRFLYKKRKNLWVITELYP